MLNWEHKLALHSDLFTSPSSIGKALATTAIRPRLDCNSTAVRPRYDRSFDYETLTRSVVYFHSTVVLRKSNCSRVAVEWNWNRTSSWMLRERRGVVCSWGWCQESSLLRGKLTPAALVNCHLISITYAVIRIYCCHSCGTELNVFSRRDCSFDMPTDLWVAGTYESAKTVTRFVDIHWDLQQWKLLLFEIIIVLLYFLNVAFRGGKL